MEKPDDDYKNIKESLALIPAEYSCKASFTPLDDEVIITFTARKINNCYTAATFFTDAFNGVIIASYEKIRGKEKQLF